ncbi:hypothetical protein JTE90_021138 [Oedothorax gibbosus]|uniref:Uncharacterized protein n=1 Tax=Oedothorax gibbosus TaxID=931172 RepID=A0AAV6U0R0_9ARAC|nr:hypothetical protein JTE90_021138 [Oedothorax gibbosus]
MTNLIPNIDDNYTFDEIQKDVIETTQEEGKATRKDSQVSLSNSEGGLSTSGSEYQPSESSSKINDESFEDKDEHQEMPEKAHSDESEVAEFLAIRNDKSKAKRKNQILCKLRNLGNNRHNCSVLKKGEGKLFVFYRPDKPVAATNYVPWVTCYGYYSKKELWKQKCPLVDGGKATKRVVAAGRNLIPAPDYIADNVKELLSSMREDKITNIIKGNRLI